jgi:hypothetical protein
MDLLQCLNRYAVWLSFTKMYLSITQNHFICIYCPLGIQHCRTMINKCPFIARWAYSIVEQWLTNVLLLPVGHMAFKEIILNRYLVRTWLGWWIFYNALTVTRYDYHSPKCISVLRRIISSVSIARRAYSIVEQWLTNSLLLPVGHTADWDDGSSTMP